MVAQLAIGLALSVGVAWFAHRKRSLSRSGAVGAVVVGSVTFGLGGWAWGFVLLTFFATSSLLSKYETPAKRAIAQDFEKGGCRDIGQVFANGGLGAMLAVLFFVTGDLIFFAAFIGALAAMNADTWATEIGVLSARRPRLITTGREVAAGTSGAISGLGMLATVAGAASIGMAALAFVAIDRLTHGSEFEVELGWLVVATSSGVAGSVADSLIGATVQATYFSKARNKVTERRFEHDGAQNELLKGLRWMNNDAVNFASSVVGALVAAIVHRLFWP
jgi:uncharacterized protein (TIGR00297 family)